MPFLFGKNRNQKIENKIFKILFIFVFVFVSFFNFYINKVDAVDPWYNPSWNYRSKITIDHTKVPNTNQTNFPVLINRIDTNWKSIGNGGHVGQADGGDIVFTSSDGITKLDHEIEKYDPTTGELIAWIEIPTVTTASDAYFYIYYGNADIADTWNVPGTWNSDFKSIYHLSNGTTLNINDSTSNGLNLNNINGVSADAGKFYGGGLFSKSLVSYLQHASNTVYNTTDYTVEAWVKFSTNNTQESIISHGNNNSTGGHYYFYRNTSNKLTADIPFIKGAVITGATSVLSGNYNHVVLTKNGNDYKIYLNGAQDASITDATAPSVTGLFNVGEYSYNNGSTQLLLNGVLDEVRVSGIARSADWIATEYNNQNSPSTFYSVAVEENSATTPGVPTSLIASYTSGTQISLSWTAPVSDGNSAITDYVVDYKLHSSAVWSTFADGISANTTAVVTGLNNGTFYDFRVSAVNAIGQGTASDTTTSALGSVKYARAGGGNWSSNSTWSTTSGGSADTTAPTSSDNVVFDSNSGNVTVDTTTAVAKTLDMASYSSAGILTITNAMKLSVSGSINLASSKFVAGGDTAELAMLGTGTLISAGNTLGAVTFNGASQDFILGDAITTRTNSQVTLTQGNLTTGAYTHTWGNFRSWITGYAKTLNITNSTINCTRPSNYAWLSEATTTNTNSTINLNATGQSIHSSSPLNTVNFVLASNSFIGGAMTINNLSVTGSDLKLYNSVTINNSLSFLGGSDNRYRLLIFSDTLGSRRTITLNPGATTSMQRVDFRDIGFASPIDLSGITGGAGDALGNNNITFNTPRNLYWKTSTSGTKYYSNYNGINPWFSETNGGGINYTDSPLPQDNVFFDASSVSGATTVNMDVLRAGTNLDFTGATSSLTFTVGQYITIYGNLKKSSAMNYNDHGGYFEGRGNHTIDNAGKTNGWPIHIISYGGSYTLQSDMTTNFSGFNIASGTFNANGFNVTSGGVTVSGNSVVNMGSGIWSVIYNLGTNSDWTNTAPSIINSENSTLQFVGDATSSYVRTFTPATGTVFNNISFLGKYTTSAQYRISNSFVINGTFLINTPNVIKIVGGKTITLGSSASLVANGTAGNLIDWNVVSGTTPWILSKSSGTINVDYNSFTYSTASGGASFLASHSTNGGNNSGWVFANAPDAPTAVLTTAGNSQVTLSWSAPGFDGGTVITDYVVEYKLTTEPTTWSTFADGVSTDTNTTITSLTNGSSYDFRVSAVNGVGQGVSSTTATSTPFTVPDAPTNVIATRGNAEASVTFTPPVFNGGSVITGYTVTSSPGNFTATGSDSPLTVTGLTNGTAYTFTVTATNVAGTGASSVASNSVTPATVPDAPTALIATPGNAQTSLSWLAPSSNGGTVVTDYVVEYKLSTEPTVWTTFADGVSTNLTSVVTGLQNAVSYDFRVSAVNNVGQGSPSISASATPVTVPDAPTIGVATPGNAEASVTFTPPVFNGGSTINSYKVTSSPGNFTATGSASPIVVTGLTNGTAYTFTVTATNAIGESSSSGASASATPVTVPDAPTSATAVEGNQQATISFVAPVFDGGTPITSYKVTSSPGNFTATGSASPIVVTGLTNGITYTFTVTATNAVGEGGASSPSNSVRLSTEPDPPVNLASNVLGSSVGLSWSAPISNGGSAITDYIIEYQLTTGGVWSVFSDAVSTQTTATVTGLSNGTSYDFRILAVNIIGQSIPSGATSATPGEPAQVLIQSFPDLTNPSIGTNVRITNEGHAEYEYNYTYCVTDSALNLCGGGDDIFSASNSKLIQPAENYDTTLVSSVPTPGNYYFHIRVTYGSQSSPAYQSFTAVATFPDAPTVGTATAGNAQASVTFTPPVSDGGSAITSYTATSNPGGFTGTGNASPVVVTGLTNGLSYTFTVTATNAVGTSPASLDSNSVIPVTIPDMPTNVLATPGNGQVALSWITPGNNGGSVITDYVVEYKLTSDSVWLVFADGISTTTNATVTGLVNGSSYDFRVSAVNAIGQSSVNSATGLPTNSSTSGGSSGGYLPGYTQPILPNVPNVGVPSNEIPIDNQILEKDTNKRIIKNKEIEDAKNKNTNTYPVSSDIKSKENTNTNTNTNTNQVQAIPTENLLIPETSKTKNNTWVYVLVLSSLFIAIGGGFIFFIRSRGIIATRVVANIEVGKDIKEITKIKKLPRKRI